MGDDAFCLLFCWVPMNFLLLFAVWVGRRVEGNEKRKKKKKRLLICRKQENAQLE